MTIHQIAELVHMKPELIRSYRVKGLIHPSQNPDNNYYDYSMKDLLELLYIKRLRSSTVSLDAIRQMYHSNEFTELLQAFQKETARLDEEIESLNRQKENLKIILEHLGEYQDNQDGVSVIHSSDEKIDCYCTTVGEDLAFDEWMKQSETFTQTIYIPKEVFEKERIPEKVPVRIGIGNYRRILKEKEMPLPEQTVICPPGIYLTHSVTLNNLEYITKKQLAPILAYAKEHHYRFDSDTTAFLVRIDKSKAETRYIFRLRIKVIPDTVFETQENIN